MSKASTRIALAFLVAFVVTLAALVFLRHGHEEGATALTSAIAGKIATLNLPQRTVELPTEKARRVRDAIVQGDYAAADKIFSDVLASSKIESWRFYPFTDFFKDISGVDNIANVDDPAFEAALNTWVGQDGSDAAAVLIRARYYEDLAWVRRGQEFSNKTSAARMDAFRAYSDKALADCETALKLDPANPYAFYLRLSILRGQGASKQMTDAFQEAIAKYPGYYPLYAIMLGVLQPKWGGDISSMYGFVERYAGGVDATSPLRLLYLDLYGYLLETATTSCYSVDNDKRPGCVSSAMQKIVTAQLEDAIPTVMTLYDHSDKYQFGLALEAVVLKMVKLTGSETYTGAILEIAANGLHSNIQLTPDKPVSNNYVIDKLVAEFWYNKSVFANALQKMLEARKDIDATTFPSEAEKDVAIAGILERLGQVHSQVGELADMIAYEAAAVSLGDKTEWQRSIWYGYDQLKDYDNLIASTTKAIDASQNVMLAHYWRGTAYTKKGDPDAALKDFTVVARSESNLGATTAIDMSMIYFKRKDNRGALDVLNRYDYLYDTDKVDRENAAVAYNNRCYAYMELGELKKALADCNASLQYGSIPDAYSKKVELMKRLSADETRS